MLYEKLSTENQELLEKYAIEGLLPHRAKSAIKALKKKDYIINLSVGEMVDLLSVLYPTQDQTIPLLYKTFY